MEPKNKIINWRIPNCSRAQFCNYQIGACVTSPIVKVPHSSGSYSEWVLEFYPKGKAPRNEEHSSIFLRLITTSDKLNFMIKFKVGIVSEQGGGQFISKIFSKTAEDFRRSGWGQSISHDELTEPANKFINSGYLKLFCELAVISQMGRGSSIGLAAKPRSSTLENAKRRQSMVQADSQLIAGLQNMFFRQLHTDVELECSDGDILKAHKAVLASQSNVLAEMLEGNPTRVEIRDYDSVTMQTVLEFLYCNETFIDSNDFSLIVAAEQLKLERLRQKWIKDAIPKLNAENVIRFLELGIKMERGHSLISESITVVIENFAEVQKTDEYQGLPRNILMKINEELIQRIAAAGNVMQVKME